MAGDLCGSRVCFVLLPNRTGCAVGGGHKFVSPPALHHHNAGGDTFFVPSVGVERQSSICDVARSQHTRTEGTPYEGDKSVSYKVGLSNHPQIILTRMFMVLVNSYCTVGRNGNRTVRLVLHLWFNIYSRPLVLILATWRANAFLRSRSQSAAAGGSPAVGAAVPPARALGMSTEVGILLDDLD